MGLFETLTSKLFGTAHAKPPVTEAAAADAAAPAAAALPAVDALADPMALLRERASQHAETLDWENSIVDLMKLVGMDSSLASRQKMAEELAFPGNKEDSAAMNTWLHKHVLASIGKRGSI